MSHNFTCLLSMLSVFSIRTGILMRNGKYILADHEAFQGSHQEDRTQRRRGTFSHGVNTRFKKTCSITLPHSSGN